MRSNLIDPIDAPVEDVLTKGLLHKVMVAFHIPARWPYGVMTLVSLVVAALAGTVWYRLTGEARLWGWVGVVHLLFWWADTAVFLWLPYRELSFGPWQPQVVVLHVPRLLGTLTLSLVAWWYWPLGFALFIIGHVLGTVILIWGAVIEPFRLSVSELHIKTDRMPAHTVPIRVLHITDVHIERLTKRETAVWQWAKKIEPDLIVITGDYVNLSYNCDPQTHAHVRQFLSQLSAPYGIYATLGSPPVDLREMVVPIFDGLPIHLMRHDWQTVNLGEGRHLTIVGMDCTHDLTVDAARLAHLMTNVPQDAPQIFLYHSPELMPQVAQHGFDLYVCGHTHGGQVRLPVLGPILTSSQLGRRYVMGLYQDGRTHLYVSRGVGLEGLSAPRVRLLAPPEMTLITIHPETS